MNRNMKAAALLAAFALLLSLGCVKQQPPGSDRDEHGCIPSAGYSWCEPLQKCIRPWEENCTAGQMVGNDRDEHGCIPSAGYSWCPEKEKCLRVWEEECPSLQVPGSSAPPGAQPQGPAGTPPVPMAGGDSALGRNPPPALVGDDSDSHGCIASAGYIWCEETQHCYRPWEGGCDSSGLGAGAPPAPE
jgi:hypothetical protein